MDDDSSGLLDGHAEIGSHLRMKEQHAKHLASIGAIPTSRLPGIPQGEAARRGRAEAAG